MPKIQLRLLCAQQYGYGIWCANAPPMPMPPTCRMAPLIARAIFSFWLEPAPPLLAVAWKPRWARAWLLFTDSICRFSMKERLSLIQKPCTTEFHLRFFHARTTRGMCLDAPPPELGAALAAAAVLRWDVSGVGPFVARPERHDDRGLARVRPPQHVPPRRLGQGQVLPPRPAPREERLLVLHPPPVRDGHL